MIEDGGDAAQEQALQIRIWNERAAFDGRLALGYVTLTARTPIRTEAQNFFAAVLS